MPKDVAERPHTYSSPAIRDRRQRILKEARRIIAEEGISALSMAEIGKRSGVAKRTLYNAFQTREGLISAAIREYFVDFVDGLDYRGVPGTMQFTVERMIAICKRMEVMRNYIGATMTLYFSHETDTSIWMTLRTMAQDAHGDWVRALDAKKLLNPWVDVDQLIHTAILMEFAILNEWSSARLAESDISHRVVTNYLTLMAGATRARARREVEELLRSIKETGLPAARETRPEHFVKFGYANGAG